MVCPDAVCIYFYVHALRPKEPAGSLGAAGGRSVVEHAVDVVGEVASREDVVNRRAFDARRGAHNVAAVRHLLQNFNPLLGCGVSAVRVRAV